MRRDLRSHREVAEEAGQQEGYESPGRSEERRVEVCVANPSARPMTRRYVSLTMTSKKRDERTGEPFRWTLVLSEGIAEETRRAWVRRGVDVETMAPARREGSPAAARSAHPRKRGARSSCKRS